MQKNNVSKLFATDTRKYRVIQSNARETRVYFGTEAQFKSLQIQEIQAYWLLLICGSRVRFPVRSKTKILLMTEDFILLLHRKHSEPATRASCTEIPVFWTRNNSRERKETWKMTDSFCSREPGRIQVQRFLSGSTFSQWVCGTERMTRSCPDILISYFPSTTLSFSSTVASGTDMKAAVISAFPPPMSNSGKQKSKETESVMQKTLQTSKTRDGVSSQSGNVR